MSGQEPEEGEERFIRLRRKLTFLEQLQKTHLVIIFSQLLPQVMGTLKFGLDLLGS
jgi:hypothetical protein